MHSQNINKVLNVIVVLLLFGCGSNNSKEPSCLILPDGSLLRCASINDLDSSLHNLTYEQYQGFTGSIDNKVLRKFTVLIEDQSQKIGRDVASDEYIEILKNENVLGLKFDKIPESIMSYEEIMQYVSSSYPEFEKRKNKTGLEIGIDEEIEFINERKEVVAKVQYSKLGISGTFVILKCISC